MTQPPEDNQEQVIDLDNPPPSTGSSLPAVAALEFQADIYEKEGPTGAGSENAKKAIEVRDSCCLSTAYTGHTHRVLPSSL